MDDQNRLTQALGRKYTVAVKADGKGYMLFIRELGLRHQCDDLARGHAELMAKKDAWIRDLAAEGLWDWIAEPGEASAQEQTAPRRWQSLVPFFVKFACVALLLLVISAKLSSAAREIGFTLEKKIDAVVLMSPDAVEAHRQKARNLALKLRPIVQELGIMFRSDRDSAGDATPVDDGSGR